MAYGTRESFDLFLGTDLVAALLHFDASTLSADVYELKRGDADAEIDAALCRRFVVPFADYPDTPRVIQTISNLLTAEGVLLGRHADGVDHRSHRNKADRLLQRILSGDYCVLGAEEVDASDASFGVVTSGSTAANEPSFIGSDDDGEDRMSGW